ncbi:fungal-specific transcription factor domain-containing protein [Aspergillus spinulosporus]
MAGTQAAARQSDSSGSGNETSSKPRHRASVACVACRERRTRCVVQPGETACTQCQETGQECIIKNDDQRRKPVSKAYVSQLQEQIQQLQAALREKEEQSLAAAQNESNSNLADHAAPEENPPLGDLSAVSAEIPPPDVPERFLPPQYKTSPARSSNSPPNRPLSPVHSTLKKSSMAHRLLSTRGYVSFDQLAHQQRYFGPTTNCHIYLDIASESEESRRQAREQWRRTQRVLSALTQESQEYLMQLFWKHYNSVIRVVHQEAFEAGRDAGGGPFYSGFLHICILAAGYRFADKKRPDMLRITLPGRESLLHREARYMLDYEMERPGGLPSIAALLLLGDLEVGCGRDNAGWLYSGMAYRLCFDIGLHLDRSGSGVSESDNEIGRMTLWACVIFDRYWALFLGRPTALKPDDLEIYELSRQFDRLGTSPPGSEKSLELQIYQALFELMEMAGKITSITHHSSSREADQDRLMYMRMAALDSELERWHSRLPETLRYTAENAATAPPSFFLLHQQFYSTMIMLHRPFAGYDDILDSQGQRRIRDAASSGVKHLSALSQATCTTCAGRIAQIFWQQRQRFDTRRIFVTGLQHSGNAATALVAAIASSTDRAANDRCMRYLECLIAVMEDMSEPYQPAEQMATIFKVVLQELRELHPALQTSNVVPARRGSSADREKEAVDLPSKRGPSARAQVSSQSIQSSSWPGDEHFPQISTLLPSPPLTYHSSAEKAASRQTTGQDNLYTDNGITSLDDSWSIFSAQDRFAINNVMAGAGSPSAFCSPWPSAETPSMFRLANETTVEQGNLTHDYMHLVENPQGSGDTSMPLATGTGAEGVVAEGSRLSQGVTQTTSSDPRIQGQQTERWKRSNGRSEDIWTEIIS